MKKIYLLVIGILLTATGFLFAEEQTEDARTPFSQKLEQIIGQNAYVKQNPGMGRLQFMHFYFPNNNVRQEPGFVRRWKRCDTSTLERAYAIYLYNMYMSTAAYREDVPAVLTVDYLGVLDGFSKCDRGFDVKDSIAFYREHQTEIKNLLKRFFAHEKSFPIYQKEDLANNVREISFLRLLEKTFAVDGIFPVYQATRNVRLVGAGNQQDVGILKQFLQRSLAKGRNRTIVFEEREFEDGPRYLRTKITQTCRQFNEECAVCSYLFGREMCEEIAANRRNWGNMRIYKVEARPKNFYLKTAAGSQKFTLADGKQAQDWGYHVATLVIMNLNGKYTPYIVDKLLAGDNPMSPDAWFQKFLLTETHFDIKPFQRLAVSEERLK